MWILIEVSWYELYRTQSPVDASHDASAAINTWMKMEEMSEFQSDQMESNQIIAKQSKATFN